MLEFDVTDSKRIRGIIDTDTACEADDPFAVAHALMSPKLIVKAVVAEHFREPGSMEKSWLAAKRVTDAMGSDIPVLKEGGGEAAQYFNPLDSNNMRQAINKYLSSTEQEREQLRTAGYENAQRFDWDKSAEVVIRIIREKMKK